MRHVWIELSLQNVIGNNLIQRTTGLLNTIINQCLTIQPSTNKYDTLGIKQNGCVWHCLNIYFQMVKLLNISTMARHLLNAMHQRLKRKRILRLLHTLQSKYGNMSFFQKQKTYAEFREFIAQVPVDLGSIPVIAFW